MKKLLILIFCLLLKNFHGQNLDYEILRSINRKDMPAWDNGLRNVSASVNYVAPASVAGILAHGYLTNDKVMIRNGYKSAVTLALAITLSTTLKYTIKRQRPYDKYPGTIVKRDHPGTFSFPSGHTTVAFATATALSLSYKKWYVTVPAYAYAGLAGYSRMRLGVHYPGDVLGGIALGIGSGLLTWKLDEMLNKKARNKKLPNPTD